ncbi:MAG: hypothetical protein CSA21_03525 [Deltaproteobacteria bacterium]|nr:MAG: hypothetical protein CSA21_03525 [Deltaproteobacteria bacterium]
MPILNVSKNKLFWWISSFLTIFLCYQFYKATNYGVGLSTDSIGYLEGARDILKNFNLKGIGTHYPPLYFILIAMTGLITGDALEALRWLQLCIIALSFIIFALIIWKGTNKTLLPAITFLLLFITSKPVLYIYTMAWSEGLFCLLALLGFYFLVNYLEDKNAPLYFLAFSALFIGLGFLTRYVGITLVITGIIAIVLYTKGNLKKRIVHCFFFSFLSLIPMFLWVGRNWLTSSEATSRRLVVHIIPMEKIQAGVDVLLNWLFISSDYPFTLLTIITLLVAISYTISMRNIYLNKTVEVCFIFIFTYISFLIISISLFDAHTPLDERILFPVYLFFILGISLLCYRAYSEKNIRSAGLFMIFIIIIACYNQNKLQQEYIFYAHANGIGFSNKKWVKSSILQWVKKLPQNTIIFTNGPDAVKIIANRSSKMIPRLSSPLDQIKNKNFERDIKNMVHELSGNKGVIVYLSDINWRWYLPTAKQLSQVIPLKIIYKSNDGVALEIQTK